jgi:hypothetical protein
MATLHPSHQHLSSRALSEAVQLCKEKQWLNRYVFFNENWVPYEERQDYLLEADIGISSSPENLEAQYSPYRARLLDYVWAGLPIITTSGDSMEEQILRHQLGKVAKAKDALSFAQAVLQILSTTDYQKLYRKNSADFVPDLSWTETTRPLQKYCSAPWHAADTSLKESNADLQKALIANQSLIRKGIYSIREEGLEGFWQRAQSYLKRRANR